MISLYPFHIHISFPYSHILPYPYISHIHVSIFLSVPPVALPLVFFHFFIFVALGRGVFFLWFFGVGIVESSPRFSSCSSFRSSSRSAFRFALRSVSFVSFLSPSFASPIVSFLRFVRVGWAVRWSRRFVLLFGIGRGFVLFRASVSWRRCGECVSLMGAVRRMAWRAVWRGV